MLDYSIKFKNKLDETQEIDVTSMVATPLNLGFHIEETYDSGAMTLPLMPR